MNTIIVIDCYQIYLQGLSTIFDDDLCIEFFNISESAPSKKCQLLVLGLCPDHFETCRKLSKKYQAPVLALLDHGCKPIFKDILIEIDPVSYLHRSAPHPIAIKAVRATLNGERFIDRKIMPWFLSVFSNETGRYNLTAQEIAVLKLVLKGLSNQEIAARLLVSLPTVKFHLKNIFRKTDTENRKQLSATFQTFSLEQV